MMLVGVRDFPNQLGAGASSSNFTTEAQFGLDWLEKMWADGTKTLYYQVGVSSGGHAYVGDHDIWRLPQADDNYSNCNSPYQYVCHRPVFANSGGAGAQISPNIAGRLAADFALCYKFLPRHTPTNASFPPSTSSTSPTPRPPANFSPSGPSISIPKQNGVTISN
jgi:endoglucanase